MKKKIILFCPMLILILSFNIFAQDSIYVDYIKAFNRIQLPLLLSDSDIFNVWEHPLDSATIIKLQINKDLPYTLYPIKEIKELNCNPIGQFTTLYNVLLLYKIFTSDAGDGAPCVIIGVYDKSLKNKSKKILFWNSINDFIEKQESNCSIFEDSIVVTKKIITFDYNNGKKIIHSVVENREIYIIGHDGKIIAKQ